MIAALVWGVTGYAIQSFELTPTYFVEAVLILVTIFLLFAVPLSKKRPATQPHHVTA